jgi:hypothetical protein
MNIKARDSGEDKPSAYIHVLPIEAIALIT